MKVLAWGTTTATADRPATDVDLVEVSSGSLTLRVLTLGAAIAGLECPDRTGRPGPVHLSLATLADYEDRARNPHLGASIGRYANRIAGASFPMGGRQVELVANNGRNQLHGGPVGFDRHVWELVEATSGSEGGEVHLRLVSADGDQGFPGTVTADASFAVSGDTLQITYRATTDASTVVNMTNHGYWNLDGSTTVRDHHIQLAADRVLPVDGDGIPTGALHEVGDTPFDLRARTELGPAMDGAGGGFDHCFAVRGAPATQAPAAATLRPAAVVDAPATGRWMSVATDQPGVQLYTGNGLGEPFHRHGSVSLETQLFPDTPNRPELGSALLEPGQDYRSVTQLRFGTGELPAEVALDDRGPPTGGPRSAP